MPAPSRVDAEIDRLYQLPLHAFTSARQELVKRIGGSDAATIRALPKPTVPMWAVNQLYWQGRPTWQTLIDAAQRLRATHRGVIAGKSGNVREATEAHRQAVATALKQALNFLATAGHPASAASHDAIARTLEALPADVRPGRLFRPLQPSGFEVFADLRIPASRQPAGQPKQPAKGHTALRLVSKRPAEPSIPAFRGASPQRERARDRERASARDALHRAERRVREATGRARELRTKLEKQKKTLATARAQEAKARRAFEEAEKRAAELARTVERQQRDLQEAEDEAARAGDDAARAANHVESLA